MVETAHSVRGHLPVRVDAVFMNHGLQGVRVGCRVKRQREGAIKAALGIREEHAPVASNAERLLKKMATTD